MKRCSLNDQLQKVNTSQSEIITANSDDPIDEFPIVTAQQVNEMFFKRSKKQESRRKLSANEIKLQIPKILREQSQVSNSPLVFSKKRGVSFDFSSLCKKSFRKF
jgi:hypothetical protein